MSDISKAGCIGAAPEACDTCSGADSPRRHNAHEDGMRYTVSGRAPSIISAALAIMLALAMQHLPAAPEASGDTQARAALDQRSAHG